MRKIDYKNALKYQIIGGSLVGKLISFFTRNSIPYFDGIRIDAKIKLIPSRLKAHIFWKFYEAPESFFVRKYIDSSFDVIEVGSSIGVLSCLLGKKLKNKQSLFCIEANPKLIPLLAQNLSKNGIMSAKIIEGALSKQKNVAFAQNESTQEGRIVPTFEPGTKLIRGYQLATLLEQNAIQKFVFVCDIEGGEVELFLEQKEAFRYCKRIIIETHETIVDGVFYTPDKIIKLIESLNFYFIERKGNVMVFENSALIQNNQVPLDSATHSSP